MGKPFLPDIAFYDPLEELEFSVFRRGFLNDMIPVPWVHKDEPALGSLKRRAFKEGQDLEVVTGNAPGWADPWARAVRCQIAEIGQSVGHPHPTRITGMARTGVDLDSLCGMKPFGVVTQGSGGRDLGRSE